MSASDTEDPDRNSGRSRPPAASASYQWLGVVGAGVTLVLLFFALTV